MNWYVYLTIWFTLGVVYYLYRYEGTSVYVLARQLLQTNLGCNYPRCLNDFDQREFEIDVNNQEDVCLLVTVFLMCINKNCHLNKSELDLEMKSLKTLLTAKNVHCDFHFDHYKSECKLTEDECLNEYHKQSEDGPKSKCRRVREYLQCRLQGCPMSVHNQLTLVEDQERELRSVGLKCDYDKYKLLTAPDCSRPNVFVCRNRACVHQSFRCDAINDCGDNSDEKNCYFFKPSRFSTKGKKEKKRNK
ncbi:uncharacterized protein LOC131948573 [Physella acuta]|uniref:uncharacterized protein LOC131948573 n=1 Tax=Physella acuta TaxID=109671 RepID=UPI0027DE7B6B|nr:uncharacterized protein LOC131948573 [Physella acuta]